MSTDEAAGHREEVEYGRAAKRLKTDEPGPEEELEEGEDSDSGSLPGNGEAESRARWRGGQKVRKADILLPDDTPSALQRQDVRAHSRLLLLSFCQKEHGSILRANTAPHPGCSIKPRSEEFCVEHQLKNQ